LGEEAFVRKLETVFCIAMLAFLTTGCSGPKSLTQTNVGKIPEWYLNAPASDETTFNSANTQVSQDMQLAIDKAKNGARTDLAGQIEVKIQNLEKRFSEETGLGVDSQLLQQFTSGGKQVISTMLNGARTEKQEIVQDGNSFRAYILMTYKVGAANSMLLDQIKKRNEMYTRFRATETYKELDAEAQKYEEWKKTQGY
jgi:hypothetical protein